MNNLKTEINLSIQQDLIEFAPNLFLKMGKIHEACGPAKIRIAILLASKTEGLIVWVRLKWENTDLNMEGISSWFSPKRLLLINVNNKNDLLFAIEEILRSGISNLTIAELPHIPNALQMRRLNLSMKKGGLYNGPNTNIGLILTPNKGGAPNIDSRWYASPLPCWSCSPNKTYTPPKEKWYVNRLFSRTEPNKEWSIEGTLSNKENSRSKPKLLLTTFK